MKRAKTISLALLLPLLLPAAALARDPGGEFQVTTEIGNDYGASASMDDQGGFIVSWVSNGSDVKARRFGPGGKPASGEFEVGHVSENYAGPTFVTLDRSGFLVIWDNVPTHAPSYLRGQRFDRDGHPLLPQPFTPGGTYQPSVASDPKGNSVIVATGSDGIVATRRNAAGQPVGGAIRVANGGAPDVTVDAAGNFVVAWSSTRGILARRYSANGAPRGAAVKVAGFVETLSGPALAGNRQGRFAVAWRRGTSVWTRFYSSSGEPRTKPVLVTGEADRETHVVAAMDAEGKLLVAWSCCSTQLASTIYGRWFDSSGAPSGGVFRISSATGYQFRPSAASGPKNRFLVTWEGPPASDPTRTSRTILGRRLAFGSADVIIPFTFRGAVPLLEDVDGL